jgi:hypothetical protein
MQKKEKGITDARHTSKCSVKGKVVFRMPFSWYYHYDYDDYYRDIRIPLFSGAQRVVFTRLFQRASDDVRRHRFRIECKHRCLDANRSFAIPQSFFRHPYGV